MAGSILTTQGLWEGLDFSSVNPLFETISEREEDGVTIKKLYIEGRDTEKGKVKIYAVSFCKKRKENMPAVVMFQSPNNVMDEKFPKMLALDGYYVLVVDYTGDYKTKDFHTEYPEDISYANFTTETEKMKTVEDSADKTCWYEWTLIGVYALSFLKKTEKVGVIAGLGVLDGAYPVWHISTFEKCFDAAVVILNTGWKAYLGYDKFGKEVVPQFNDETLKFAVGIDPQSYAPTVKCPILLLNSTNSTYCDSDRAFDTFSRINQKVYSVIDFSVNYRERLSYTAVNDVSVFFDKFLKEDKTLNLPKLPEISVSDGDGEITVEVKADLNNLYSVRLYCAEETVNSSIRAWRIIDSKKEFGKDGKVKFTVTPFIKSERVFFFARARYNNEFTVSSDIIEKDVGENEKTTSIKNNVLYSQRNYLSKSYFAEADDSDDSNVIVDVSRGRVKELKGPMGITGMCAENGLTTFKINAKADKPTDGAVLLFDAHLVSDGTITVTLTTNLCGDKKEYSVKIPAVGGNVWNNVKVEMERFKTEEGIILRSYENVNMLTIKVDQEYLINNVLWI